MTNEIISGIRSSIGRRLVGKTEAIDLVLCALLCRGHVLIEDVPGTGKTTLAKALAGSTGCSFKRIQFTPDVTPSDITGFSMFDAQAGEFIFRPGAIFNQIVLADEINRTSPKTQSALLEVMQENQVTVDGISYDAPKPFMVLATQNPVEYTGTFPLPEAQMDRFFVRVSLGYPSLEEEKQILDRHDRQEKRMDENGAEDTEEAAEEEGAAEEGAAGVEDLLSLQADTDKIHVSPALKGYISEIIAKTRAHPDVLLGASPRGAIFLMNASKGSAFLSARTYATPDDVQKLAAPVLAHRLLLKPEARLKSASAARVIAEILETTPLPEA